MATVQASSTSTNQAVHDSNLSDLLFLQIIKPSKKARRKTAAEKRRDVADYQRGKSHELGVFLQEIVAKERGWSKAHTPCGFKDIMLSLVVATKCWVCGYISGYGSLCRVACQCSISTTALIADNYQNKVFWQHVNENCRICGKRRLTKGVLQWCNCLLRCKAEFEDKMGGWR